MEREKRAPWDIDNYLLVGSAKLNMNVALVETVFKGEANMDITMEVPMKGCLRVLHLGFMSGPVHVSCKYEPKV